MQTLMERVDAINLRKVMEGSREDILKSFFSLCKTNGGFFKSEKQASFLKSQLEAGNFFITQVLNFGTSSASRRTVDWNVVCDDKGVVEITKRTNSKGSELYWERDNSNTISGKQSERAAQNRIHIQNDMKEIVAQWKQHVAEKQAELEKMKSVIGDPAFDSIRARLVDLIQRTEAEISEYQDRINRENAKWGWDR